MIIKEMELKNFGKFSEKKLSFSDGINVIFGANESGKTTLYTAIGGLLFGLEKKRGRAAQSDAYTVYQPWERKTWYEAAMRFETGGKQFFLERNFYHGEKNARLICETDGEELSVDQGDLRMILGETDADLFFNTTAVGQLKVKPQELIYDYLQNYIGNLQEEGNRGIDVVRAIEILEKKKKALEQEKKKKVLELQRRLEDLDAKLELIQKDIQDCQKRLVHLRERQTVSEAQKSQVKQNFLKRLMVWLKRILFAGRTRRENEAKRQEQEKNEAHIHFLCELLGEKESTQEEILVEKEVLFEKIHEQNQNEEAKAITLAMERIAQISTVRREEVLERLEEKASKALFCISGGKYEKLILTEDGKPEVFDGNRRLKVFQVSAGCADQIYLSLRIAFQDLFFEEESMPLMFDDAFVYFDEERLERLLGYLASLSRQVFIFSCQKREWQLMEKREIEYQRILL